MVSPRYWLVWLGLLVLLGSPTAVTANPACDAAAQTVTRLEQEQQLLTQQRQQLRAITRGQLASPEQLDELLGHPLDQRQLLPAQAPKPRTAANSRCRESQDDLIALTDQLTELDAQLFALRQQLDQLPLDQRSALASLAHHYQQLETVSNDDGDVLAAAAAQSLRLHISQVWALLPALLDQPQQALAKLDPLWVNPPQLTPPPSATPIWGELLKNRLAIQQQIRLLRASLWQQKTPGSELLNGHDLAQAPQLLRREAVRLWQRAQDIATIIRFDFSNSKRTGGFLPLVQNGVALVLGIAGFLVLIRLARRTRLWALSLHDKVVRNAGERRWLRNTSRLISGIAPLLPWLLLWLLLGQLGPWLDTPSTRLLQWLLPLAQLYVIYGLITLVGEWLLVRIAQSANTYLSGEQLRQVHGHAQLLSRWLMLPLLPLLLTWQNLGPSLLYDLLLTLLLVTLYWGVGRLLALRKQDYLLCLQAVLPSRLDPLAEQLLRPALFWLFAPLLLPLALASFLVGFMDRLLADFDWYMRFKARWFRLRTRINQDDEVDGDEEESFTTEHYERWFASVLPEGSKTPFIDTGLVAAMEKNVQRWHQDKTDENALVVAGEKGCGKTVSIAKLEKTLAESCDGLQIIDLKVPAKTCTPEAIQQLIGDALGVDLSDGPAALVKGDEQRQPTLVVLDEAQNFFLTQIGGLSGWSAVLNLVNARVDNVFWLLMINNQSWAYLCNVFGRDYQFRNVIKVKRWGQGEIRSLILSRNHISGHQIRYDEVLLSSRGPEAGNVRNAEQRYFSMLWDACRGNPMVALRLWLTSVKTQGRQVVVGLPTPPSATVLDSLGENALFVYAAIATHENLTSHEITAVTHLPENVVRYALKGGFDAGFLQKSEDGRYRLVPLWYQQVISYLTRKNLLNE